MKEKPIHISFNISSCWGPKTVSLDCIYLNKKLHWKNHLNTQLHNTKSPMLQKAYIKIFFLSLRKIERESAEDWISNMEMTFDTARCSQNRCTNHKLGTHWLWLHNHHSSRCKELLCNRGLHDGFWYLIPTFLSFQVQVIVFFNCWFTFYASKPKNLCLMRQKKNSMGNNIAPWDDKLNFRTVHLHILRDVWKTFVRKDNNKISQLYWMYEGTKKSDAASLQQVWLVIVLDMPVKFLCCFKVFLQLDSWIKWQQICEQFHSINEMVN